MIRYFMMGGPMMFALTFILLAVGILVVVNIVRILMGKAGSPTTGRSIDGLLFWGAVAAVFGFLGQWIGYYKVATIIMTEGRRIGVNPSAVIMGFGESLVTAVVGLAILIGCAILWYGLRSWATFAAAGKSA